MIDQAGRNCAFRGNDTMQAPITVDVQTVPCSAGADYFVRIRCGDRTTTPFRFKERFKAAYEADHFAWVFGLRADEPYLLAYGPESHPNETTSTPVGDRGASGGSAAVAAQDETTGTKT